MAFVPAAIATVSFETDAVVIWIVVLSTAFNIGT
jgi:hypothetical protein